MFPVPDTVTFNVSGSLVHVSFLFTEALIRNVPTAPLNEGGALGGNGFTLIFTGRLFNVAGISWTSGIEKSSKKGSEYRRRTSRLRATSRSKDAIISSPVF